MGFGGWFGGLGMEGGYRGVRRGGGVCWVGRGGEEKRRGEERRGEGKRDDGGEGVWGLEGMMLWGGVFERGVLEGDC